MKGFRDFLLRGNIVELAVAFIMAAAFTAVVTATVQMIMDGSASLAVCGTSRRTIPAVSRSAPSSRRS